MTEIEELIKQAEAVKKKWRKPTNEPKLSWRKWQQLLDGETYFPHPVQRLKKGG